MKNRIAVRLVTLSTFAALCLPMSHAAGRTATANYILRCSGCHGLDGSGNEKAAIPDFRNYVGGFATDPDGRTYVLRVPGVVNANLSDSEIAAVMNYVMQAWGGMSLRGAFVSFTPQEVAARRDVPVRDVVGFRRQVVARLHDRGIPTAKYPWP